MVYSTVLTPDTSNISSFGKSTDRLQLQAATNAGVVAESKLGEAVWALSELAEALPQPQSDDVRRIRNVMAADVMGILLSTPGLQKRIWPPDEEHTGLAAGIPGEFPEIANQDVTYGPPEDFD